MKKLMLTIILSIFLISFISAEVQTIGPFKQGDCIQLPQTCGNCTTNVITSIQFPNGLKDNATLVMQKNGGDYNQTFCSKYLGRYIVNGYGNPDGENIPWAYDFEVTTTGKGSGNTIPLFLLLIATVLLSVGLWNRNEYFGLFSGFVFVGAGVYMMAFGLGFIADTYTQLIAYISLGLGLVLCFISMLEIFGDDNETIED